MLIMEKAPAKINLSLDTPMRYFDGLPQWNMVMSSIDLADYVAVETHASPKTIKVYTDSGFLPNDQRNLAYQAAHILKTRFHQSDGVTIRIKKHIPVAAGLGGGSSDAAAVLRALNQAWELGLSVDELAKLALSIDSDVPFCVYGHTAHVTGHGELVTPLPNFPHYWVIVAKPKVSVSTPAILKQINYATLQHAPTNQLVDKIKAQAWSETFQYMGNSLEGVTGEMYTEIKRIKDKMLQLGADVAQMSGTGPTVFAICHAESRAKRVYNSMKGFCDEVYQVVLL